MAADSVGLLSVRRIFPAKKILYKNAILEMAERGKQ